MCDEFREAEKHIHIDDEDKDLIIKFIDYIIQDSKNEELIAKQKDDFENKKFYRFQISLLHNIRTFILESTENKKNILKGLK